MLECVYRSRTTKRFSRPATSRSWSIPSSRSEGGSHRPVTGFTIVEALISIALFSVLCVVLWGILGQFVGRSSRLSVTTGAARSMVQQQSRQTIRKLFYRLQEGIEILQPLPGHSSSSIEFKDLLNRKVRLRHDAQDQVVVTEREQGGIYVPERDLADNSTMVQLIEIRDCTEVVFTTLTPTTVFVSFTTRDNDIGDSFLSIVHLKNSGLTVE